MWEEGIYLIECSDDELRAELKRRKLYRKERLKDNFAYSKSAGLICKIESNGFGEERYYVINGAYTATRKGDEFILWGNNIKIITDWVIFPREDRYDIPDEFRGYISE